jgi:predicted dinucleotide-utilizing enzyme
MIKPGDKFTSVGIPRTVWVVVREAALAQAMPPHFQLVHAMKRSRTIMMSTSALLDKNLFKRAED